MLTTARAEPSRSQGLGGESTLPLGCRAHELEPSLFLPGTSLAGRWSQELGVEPQQANLDVGVLNTRPSFYLYFFCLLSVILSDDLPFALVWVFIQSLR